MALDVDPDSGPGPQEVVGHLGQYKVFPDVAGISGVAAVVVAHEFSISSIDDKFDLDIE